MAETKTTKTEDREDIFIPRAGSMEDPNLFVGINGRNFILPKGQTSNVPKYVADEIRRAWAAQAKGEENKDELLSKGKEPVYQI
jgi:hypothetical protein